tara:strand:+ start:1411 stop:1548 length:138 start_codon:yes stop_codon:yes gene_type:complete
MNQTHEQKLAAAIEWLRARGKYCLEVPLLVSIYTPVHGIPLECKK